MTLMDIQALHEPYAYLYVGDYSADTLDLAAREHRALRLLLLETWVRGPVGNVRLAQVAGLTRAEWLEVKPAVLPLLRAVQPRIAQSLKNVRAYDGQRLPADDWHIVRSIVWERDGHACVYCGATQALSGDHIVPLSQGGSNALTNLVTACRPCNLSKASSTLEEWRVRRSAAVTMKRGVRRRILR
jgi:5-methylcytosine-specific restriction endonuclease McrA